MRIRKISAIAAALMYGSTGAADAATLAKIINATNTEIVVNGSKLPGGDYLYAQVKTTIKDAAETKVLMQLGDRSVTCKRDKGYNGWSTAFTGWLIEGTELYAPALHYKSSSKLVNICIGTSKLFEIYCIKVVIRQSTQNIYPSMVLSQLAEKECGSERLYNAIHGR